MELAINTRYIICRRVLVCGSSGRGKNHPLKEAAMKRRDVGTTCYKGLVVRCGCNSDWARDLIHKNLHPLLFGDPPCPKCRYYPWVMVSRKREEV